MDNKTNGSGSAAPLPVLSSVGESVTDMSQRAAAGISAAAAAATGSSTSSSSSSSSTGIGGFFSSWFGASSSSSEDGGIGSSVFGSLNTVFARVAFVFLLVICFYLLGSLGVAVIGHQTRPTRSPILIKGLLPGNSAVDISQDPKKTSAILVQRSNNENGGAEFTWAVWLFVQPPDVVNGNNGKYSAIFTKGSGDWSATTGTNSSNGPGMYVRTVASTGATELMVAMDTTARAVADEVKVMNLPIHKWVHVVVLLQNTQLQVYVNAALAATHTLAAAPRQNFYNVAVNPNGGFGGALSDLRYFDHAINVLQMRSLLASGPNTAPSTAVADASKAGGTYTYLSDLWYA
jgi:hypothetical protein